MRPSKKGNFILLPILLCMSLVFCSCGAENKQSGGDSATKQSESSQDTKGSRDNTPVVLTGQADGTVTYGSESVTIDASHISEGYIMVSYTGTNEKVKLQITGPDEVVYTYDLHGDYETFPLTAGSGSYTVGVFENIEGTSYSTLFTQTIDVKIDDEFGPYLYANQYVNFDGDSKVVEKAEELSKPCNDDLEVIEQVYNYMISNFTYDYDKAESVQSGYLPDVDVVFEAQTGICFDYAAVMAAMLRSQRIPTRLEVGYAGDVYHAWISTYIEEQGWVNGIIQFDGKNWELMDPTFESTSSKPEDFITNTDEYITKFVY